MTEILITTAIDTDSPLQLGTIAFSDMISGDDLLTYEAKLHHWLTTVRKVEQLKSEEMFVFVMLRSAKY